eukprot:3201339-Rhodomonas_salina.1
MRARAVGERLRARRRQGMEDQTSCERHEKGRGGETTKRGAGHEEQSRTGRGAKNRTGVQDMRVRAGHEEG